MNFKEESNDVRIEREPNGNEIYVFDPYNPLNKEITQPEVETILKSFGLNITINNFNLYRRAFVHQSYIRRPNIENERNNIRIVPKPPDCLGLYTKSNERLEFLGDGVLDCITKYYLYKRFPKESEGFMTTTKIALVKNEAIGRIAFEIGLHKWFILSKTVEGQNMRLNYKKLGCLFESFIGAIFLDCNKFDIEDEEGLFQNLFHGGLGFQYAQVFLENVFEKHVDWVKLIQTNDNYKTRLQEIIQPEFRVPPQYMEIEENEEEIYYMGVYLCLGQPVFGLKHHQSVSRTEFDSFSSIHNYVSFHGNIFLFLGEGKHKMKKKAEQIACENAIQYIQQHYLDTKSK